MQSWHSPWCQEGLQEGEWWSREPAAPAPPPPPPPSPLLLLGLRLAKCIHPVACAPTCARSPAAGIRQRRSLASVCYALCAARPGAELHRKEWGADERHPSVLRSLSLHQRHRPSPLTLSCLSPPMSWGFPAHGPAAPHLPLPGPGQGEGPGRGRAGARSQAGGKAETAEPGFGVLGSGQGWQPSVPLSSLPLGRLPSVLCQGGPWRWSTGHCRVPSRGRGTERGQGSAPDTWTHGTLAACPPAAALPPGLPLAPSLGTLHTHHISAAGAGWWDWVAPLGLSGLAVIHGQCP